MSGNGWRPRGFGTIRNLAGRAWRPSWHHEAGHAVIGLALQLPVALAWITEDGGGRRAGFVSEVQTSGRPVGRVFARNETGRGPYWKATNSKKAADLDAFGNSVRKKERTPEERHAEVIMCLAGGMAEGKSLGEDIFDFSPPDPPSPKALAFATETGGQIAKAHHAGNATPLAVIWILLAIIAAS